MDMELNTPPTTIQPPASTPVVPPVTPPVVSQMPMTNPKHKTPKWLWLLLLLVLLVATAFGYMWWQDKNKQPATQPTQTTITQVETKAALTCTGEFTKYEDTDEKFGFCYPTAWGEVTTASKSGDANGIITGNRIEISFSKQTKAKAGLLSKDYEEQGRDGACGFILGIFPSMTLDQIKDNNKENTTPPTAGDAYKTYTKTLKSTDDNYTFEMFEAGQPDGIGGCPGLSASGYKFFKSQDKYLGIQFFWHGTTNADVPVSEYDKYVATPNDYFSAADRTSFVATVDSAISL